MPTKIQIIENDSALSSGLRAMLSVLGFSVEVQDSGHELQNIINSAKIFAPDYAIIGLAWPNTVGLRILSGLRADEETAAIPVIVLSDHSAADTREHCDRLGASHYFIRSELRTEDLAGKISKIIKNRQRR